MAYNRRYWRRYYRRYYRGKYNNSYYKTRMTRNFKASAQNMTQGGTFNISCRFEDHVDLFNAAYAFKTIDIANKLAASDMHTYLSNVFDQYRVEKLTIRIKPLGDTATSLANPCVLFTAMDRSSFANSINIAQIRTYGSYKETMVSGAKDISPTHTCYIGQSNLTEWSTYTDTKNRVTFPHVIWGVNFATAQGSAQAAFISNASIEIDAMVRYRGVRLDTSAVDPNEVVTIENLLINNITGVLLFNGQVNRTFSLSRVSGSTFSPEEKTVYVAVSNSGSEKDKILRALFCTETSLSEIISSDDYDLYKGVVPITEGADILLKLSIKDSVNEISVGVPEADGRTFPVSSDLLPTVFAVN